MFRIIVDSLRTGILTEARPFDVRPPFGFPGDRFRRDARSAKSARGRARPARFTVGAAGPAGRTLSLRMPRAFSAGRASMRARRRRSPSRPRRRSRRLHPRPACSRPRRSTSMRRRAGARSARWRCRRGPSLDESAARLRERIRGPARTIAPRAAGGRRQLQRLRAGDRGHDQSAVRPRALRHALRRQPAARRPAARDRSGHTKHGDRAAPDLRGRAGAARRRGRRRMRLQRRDLRRGHATRRWAASTACCRLTCTFPVVRRGRRRS